MLHKILKRLTGCTNISYSQNGEDIFLSSYFNKTPKGFYVDVGAHHPRRFSNTFLLYKKGWTGINIDATPGSINLFKKERPRDTNLESAVANTKTDLTLFTFKKPALNTLSKELAESYQKQGHHIVAKIPIKTERLDQLLDTHVPKGRHIALLSIDVEGLDLDVLRSNNWDKYRPEIIVVEDLDFHNVQAGESIISNYLKDRGYTLVNSMGPSLFFKLNK